MPEDPYRARPATAKGRLAAVDWIRRRLLTVVGGPARFQVIAILACVLALDSADKGAVGAVGPQLKESLGLSNSQLGSLTSVTSAVGALATLPVGMLTDRAHRVRLLSAAIVLWSLAMIIGGLAPSFLWLLVSRVALGAVTATTGPVIASLVGDFFRPAERGRIWGFVLSGELLGAGIGLLLGGLFARLLSWRAAFWFMALLGACVAVMLLRHLAEPARGGQSRLVPEPGTQAARGDHGGAEGEDVARAVVRGRAVEPDRTRLPRRDPARMSMWEAARYILSIRSNVVLIIASAVGYFFFAGLRTFALVFVEQRYDVGTLLIVGLAPLLGLGGLLGLLGGGRIADRLTRRGHVAARMVVPAFAYLTAAVFFVPGLLTTSLMIAIPVFIVAAAALAAANPPLDAARLDIMHFRLWGRAESVRTVLRMGGEAVAPITFGWTADMLGPGGQHNAQGLQYTFLIMLVPLAANAAILLYGRRTYPRDVATADAAERARRGEQDGPGRGE